jgi:bifunctional non-homologous end joining protein LigD
VHAPTVAKRETDRQSTVGGIRLTHGDKLLYPAEKLTKQEVAEYLEAVAERMLVHLADRPLSLLRCPDGVGKQCFFQRHAGAGMPKDFRRLPATDKEGKEVEYLYIADAEGLIAAAQFDVLEFHIWGAHADDISRPDRIVLDLDPDPSVSFPAVREAAGHVRSALEALALASFAMLTGGKGVHVVAPIERHHPWPVVKAFTKALAERFAAEAPERFVATMRKARRAGRIFIDHFRNEHTASSIAPYSPRARASASIAWPVAWNELMRIESADEIKLRTATERLGRPDPWSEYPSTRQKLTVSALHALNVSE